MHEILYDIQKVNAWPGFWTLGLASSRLAFEWLQFQTRIEASYNISFILILFNSLIINNSYLVLYIVDPSVKAAFQLTDKTWTRVELNQTTAFLKLFENFDF